MKKLLHFIVASLAAAHLIVPPPLPAGDLDGLFFFNDEMTKPGFQRIRCEKYDGRRT
ncbi:MAG: hypothetical protein R3F11_09550 [Verrucomicrobiales bacterium]